MKLGNGRGEWKGDERREKKSREEGGRECKRERRNQMETCRRTKVGRVTHCIPCTSSLKSVNCSPIGPYPPQAHPMPLYHLYHNASTESWVGPGNEASFYCCGVLSLNWIHSKIISGATFRIIGLTKIPKIEFLLLNWIYWSIRIMTVL